MTIEPYLAAQNNAYLHLVEFFLATFLFLFLFAFPFSFSFVVGYCLHPDNLQDIFAALSRIIATLCPHFLSIPSGSA